MNFFGFIHFKMGRVLLFTSMLYCYPNIYATGSSYAKDNDPVHEITLAHNCPGRADEFLSCTDTVPKHIHHDKSNGWEILFDGKNTGKWRSVNSDTFPSSTWTIKQGTLFVDNHKKGEDIITRDEYHNFELVFDFKLTDTANSGIKYFVAKIRNNNTGMMEWNGPEYQIIDDYNHPEIKYQQQGKASTASLYLVYAPENKKLLPAGQWNNGKIIVNGSHVEHWLNGVKVVSYERGTKDFRDRMASTKFKDYDNYGESAGGRIMLTDHDGDKVYFRNIKIKRLK
jgi:hypothetical protein